MKLTDITRVFLNNTVNVVLAIHRLKTHQLSFRNFEEPQPSSHFELNWAQGCVVCLYCVRSDDMFHVEMITSWEMFSLRSLVH